MRRILTIFLLGFTLLLAAPEARAQCAMCVATVESNLSTGESRVGAGLNTGILYLMGIPYLIFAVIGYAWWRNSRSNASRDVKWT